jgi:hypothetical protein
MVALLAYRRRTDYWRSPREETGCLATRFPKSCLVKFSARIFSLVKTKTAVTNPYRPPETASLLIAAQPLTPRVRTWLHVLFAGLLVLLALPTFFYGLVIMGLVVSAEFSTSPLPAWLFLACGCLISLLGASLVMIAFGVWRPSRAWILGGALAGCGSVLLYVALGVWFA